MVKASGLYVQLKAETMITAGWKPAVAVIFFLNRD
jgi:hypothetical protein